MGDVTSRVPHTTVSKDEQRPVNTSYSTPIVWPWAARSDTAAHARVSSQALRRPFARKAVEARRGDEAHGEYPGAAEGDVTASGAATLGEGRIGDAVRDAGRPVG
jgi:hypothetical protein